VQDRLVAAPAQLLDQRLGDPDSFVGGYRNAHGERVAWN
jgi:hypothetical protein